MDEEIEYESVLTIFMRHIIGNWYELLGRDLIEFVDVELIEDIKTENGVLSNTPRKLRQLAISILSSNLAESYIKTDTRFELMEDDGYFREYLGTVKCVNMRVTVSSSGTTVELEKGTSPQPGLEALIEYVTILSPKRQRNKKLVKLFDE